MTDIFDKCPLCGKKLTGSPPISEDTKLCLMPGCHFNYLSIKSKHYIGVVGEYIQVLYIVSNNTQTVFSTIDNNCGNVIHLPVIVYGQEHITDLI